MAAHPLESKYGLNSHELLDAINARFRLKVALEGAVAEVQMEKHIAAAMGSVVARYETHDLDGHPDFSIWLPRRSKPLLAECKNIRESGKEGGEAYRQGGKIVGYKVETQKTRAATGDPTSRYHGVEQYDILGVCLGKKTGDWVDFLFVRTVDLTCHAKYGHKLVVMQRVPLPDASDLRPWYDDLAELLRHIDDPPCR
ncbi:MAG TPA: hypothetical protein VIK18_23435 [Pirellulales bacterium]